MRAFIGRLFGRGPNGEAESLKNQGNDRLGQGDFEGAVTCYRQAIALDASYAEAHSNLGLALSQLGRTTEAEAAYVKALALKPNLGSAHFNIGTLLASRGDFGAAFEHCERARELLPKSLEIYIKLGEILYLQHRHQQAVSLFNDALAVGLDDVTIHLNLGICYRELGRSAEAEASFRHAIVVQPENALAHYELGLILKQEGMRAAAEQAFRDALACSPDYADASVNLGLLLADSGKTDAAEQAYRHALNQSRAHPEALNNLGILLMHERRFEEAERCFQDALAVRPDVIDTRCNLGYLRHKMARYGEAEVIYREILRDRPRQCKVHGNLGYLYAELRRFDEAEVELRCALALEPNYAEARRDLGYTLLSLGRYAEGWPLHEARYDPGLTNKKTLIPTPQLPFGPWRGEPLLGKSLLVCYEQGFGDEIQFARYIPVLKRRGAARIGLVCTAPLAELFQSLSGIDALYVAGTADQIPSYDFWVLSMSVALHLDTTLATVPADVPYLSVSEQRKERWRDRLPRRPSVGLVWKGNTKHSNDTNRSLPNLRVLAPLWEVSDARFVSLQKWAGEDEANSPPPGQMLTHLGTEVENFADMAAIVSHLDLVICVDTAIAHLSGALGKACWVLLPHTSTDWRWMQERSDSPWYPSLRLFRQKAAGDWNTVISEVTEALREHLLGSR